MKSKRSLHPAWFSWEAGKQPDIGEISDSLGTLQKRIDSLGMLLFVSGESDSGLIDQGVLRNVGDSLLDMAKEIGALVGSAHETEKIVR
jgi:hypothetical protein